MCTALISVDPASSVPVLLLFARDEMAGRPWLPPGRHWPDRPELVGGKDLREGGTWLAVHPGRAGGARPAPDAPARPRAACLLNGIGAPLPPERRHSRGRLPLAAASGALVHRLDLTRYEPFHLLIAEAGATTVSLLSWDGARLGEQRLGAGTHLVSNRGLELAGVQPSAAPHRATRLIDARIAHFAPLLAAAERPEPRPGAGSTREAWGEGWMRLANGDGLDPEDVRALIGRHDWGPGQMWLTSSVSLVAVGRRTVRYDVSVDPGRGEWSEVPVQTGAAAPSADGGAGTARRG